VRDRNYESDPSQPERDRRFGERGGFRDRDQGARQRFAERSWRDEDEGFGDDFERQGFAGGGQGGWRQEYSPYGPYGQQDDPYRQRRASGPRGSGQGVQRGEPARPQDDFGQRYDRRQEWGIDRNEGYGPSQGQRYGQGFEPERGASQGFGAYGQGRPQGRFTGRGPKGWQRSDESILERVNETLEQHPDIDATEIEVTIAKGEIVLRGTVDDRRAKRLAEDAIENLPGVKDVRNEIRVQEPHRQQFGQPEPGQPQGQTGASRDNGGGKNRT
jgi:hypothetical protein